MRVGYKGSFRSTSEPLWLITSKEERATSVFYTEKTTTTNTTHAKRILLRL